MSLRVVFITGANGGLGQAIAQLDSLSILATRLTPQAGAFTGNSAQAQRYQSLAAVARGVDPRDKKAREKFEKLVREFWQDIAATRLKGLKVTISWAYATSHAKPVSVPQSQILLFTRYGMDVTVAAPKEFPPCSKA